MKQVILLTFIQRDKLRSLPPEIFEKCVCLGSGKVTNNLYTWRYSTTVEVAMALRLMGLCIFEEQNEESKPDRRNSGRQRKTPGNPIETP